MDRLWYMSKIKNSILHLTNNHQKTIYIENKPCGRAGLCFPNLGGTQTKSWNNSYFK
jgi:hypothetical protein